MSQESYNGNNLGSSAHGKLIFYIVSVLIITSGAGYWFFANKINNSLKDNSSVEPVNISSNKELGETKDSVMASLNLSAEAGNGRYGNWPIMDNLSVLPDRGNPFVSFSEPR